MPIRILGYLSLHRKVFQYQIKTTHQKTSVCVNAKNVFWQKKVLCGNAILTKADISFSPWRATAPGQPMCLEGRTMHGALRGGVRIVFAPQTHLKPCPTLPRTRKCPDTIFYTLCTHPNLLKGSGQARHFTPEIWGLFHRAGPTASGSALANDWTLISSYLSPASGVNTVHLS